MGYGKVWKRPTADLPEMCSIADDKQSCVRPNALLGLQKLSHVIDHAGIMAA